MSKNNWDFLLRSNQDLKKEVSLLAKKYDCTFKDVVENLIRLGLEEIQKENLLENISKTKKFLEKDKGDSNE